MPVFNEQHCKVKNVTVEHELKLRSEKEVVIRTIKIIKFSTTAFLPEQKRFWLCSTASRRCRTVLTGKLR